MQKYTRLLICALAVCGWGYGCADNSQFEPDISCTNDDELFDPQLDGCRKVCVGDAFYNYKSGECVQCGENEVFDFNAKEGMGQCVPKNGACGPQKHLDENGECVPDDIVCENEDELYDPQIGECRQKCEDGAFYHYKAEQCILCSEDEVFDFSAENGMGQCVPKSGGCNENEVYDPQIDGCRKKCDEGAFYNDKNDECVQCGENEVFDFNAEDGVGQCVPKSTVDCGAFKHLDESGNCVDDIVCADGELYNPADKKCIPKSACPLGEYADDTGKCIKVCRCDEILDSSGNCVPNTDLINRDFNELNQRALIETANAFYFRGDNLQNDVPRASFRMTPESATSQKLQFTLYSAFIYQVYYQALGIVLPNSSLGFQGYGNAYANDANHPDVRYFYSKREGLCDALNKDSQLEMCSCETINADSELKNYFEKLDPDACTEREYLSPANCRNLIYKNMVDVMQPGDIIGFNNSSNGSANLFMVYQEIPAQMDKKAYKDIIIIRAPSNYETKNESGVTNVTKLSRSSATKGLSWTSKPAEALERHFYGDTPQTVDSPFNDVTEGTVRFDTFSNFFDRYILTDTACKITDFVVLRPAIDDKQYFKVSGFSTSRDYYKTVTDENGASTIEYQKWASHVCDATRSSNCVSVEKEPYKIQPATWCRIKYPGMFIQKISDIPDGSTVSPGDTITYSIEIRNNNDRNNYAESKVAYSDLYVQENLSEWVELVDPAGGSLYDNQGVRALAWHLDEIKPGETKTIQYKVQVKKDTGLLQKSIVSTGTVAQIPSGMLHHTIANNLSSTEVSALQTEFNKALNVKNGTDILTAIQTAYKNALNIEVPLANFRLGSIAADKSSAAYTYYQDETRKDLYAENAKALILTDYGYNKDYNVENVRLNTRHALSKMVYNNYYSAVYTDVNNPTLYIYQKHFDNSANIDDIRSQRNEMVYPNTLSDGDILIYVNTNDYVMNGDTQVNLTKDNGMYAFIYLNGGFMGGQTGTPLTEAKPLSDFVVKYHYAETDMHNNMAERFGDMPKLFGKDFYVILRPALIKE